ncbi:MAG: VanZ family protein [Longimicrobiales bacterium]
MQGDITPARFHHWRGDTGTRLTIAMLGYYLAVIAVITLVPFRFEMPDGFRPTMRWTLLDASANVLLFLPLGFLQRLAGSGQADPGQVLRVTRGGSRVDPAALQVLAIGLLASTIIETIQIFEPARFASPMDIIANGAGAWAGALLCDRVAKWIRPDSQLVGRLSLEIPLMGLIYMLIPLLWLSSLAVGADAERLGLLLLTGLFGGQLLAFVHRHRPGRPGLASVYAFALAAGLGTFVGVFPAVPQYPGPALLLALAVAAFVRIRAGTGARTGGDRRFERIALRAAMPIFATYLLSAAWFARPDGPTTGIDRIGILRTLEMVVSFTVLGYIVAEWRGRVAEKFGEAVRAVVMRALPLGALTIGLRFLPAAPAQALVWLVLTILSSVYGAGLYRLQRAHVQQLITAASAPRPAHGSREVAA